MNAMARLFAGAPAEVSELEVKVPTLREASPRYADIDDRRSQLGERLQALDAECLRLSRVIAKGMADIGIAERNQRIAELAGVPVPGLRQSDVERLQLARAERDEVKEALRLVDIERNEAWLDASALVCEAVAEVHKGLQRNVFHAAVRFHEAWSRQQALLDDVRRTGAAFSALRPELPDFLGRDPTVRSDDFAQWFRDLVRAGHVTRDELPAAYR